MGASPGIQSLWAWLFTGLGQEPGTSINKEAKGAAKKGKANAIKKAVKCDMCRDIKSGPACVRACPTGAALRISPENFLDYTGVNQ